MIGGGSLPGQGVATWCARIEPAAGAHDFAARLRQGEVPGVARIEDGAVLLDPRTVSEADDGVVGLALEGLIGAG
jgi:seryl-tRNA(Sec) selenium transferase